MAVVKLLLCLTFVHMALAKGSEATVECTQEVMKVTVPMDGDRRISYLDQFKDFEPCQPTLENNVATFMLDLQAGYYKCGLTRVINKMTNMRTFYHKVIIEGASGDRETVLARCLVSPKGRPLVKRDTQAFPLDFNEPEPGFHKIREEKRGFKTGKVLAHCLVSPKGRPLVKRDTQAFPLDFNEPDVLNITRSETGHAPEPMLFAIVKKNGVPVPRNDSVSPGTHLTMEIFLDNESAPVYGLFVNYMYATNTDNQQETIILNGCSLDASLFNNFQTTDGDLLVAKFRAFKFPDTTYVMFIGTVNVCLDKCPGVQCSNGAEGYGRKRRSIYSEPSSNRVYEVSLTTFLKVDWKEGEKEAEDVLALIKNLKAANQMLDDKDGTPATVAERTQDNKLVLHSQELTSNSVALTYSCLLLLISALLAF